MGGGGWTVSANEWAKYLTMDPVRLLERATFLAEEIASSHRELAMLRTDERREKAKAYLDAAEAGTTSGNGRDRYAQIQTLAYTTEILPLEAAITTLVAEYGIVLMMVSLRYPNAHVPDATTLSPSRSIHS